MKHNGDVLIGGGVFTHERLSFGNSLHKDKDFKVRTITLKDLQKPCIKLDGDYVILFGLKKLERILRKARYDRKKIKRHIWQFMDKTIPAKMPVIVEDDWTIPTLNKIGNELRKYLFSKFNIKLYLLREYLTYQRYPKQVVSFTMPCNDYTAYMVPSAQKRSDIFFQGNVSNKDRSSLMPKIRKRTIHLRCHYKLMTGGVKNTKDRLPFREFLKTMACSHFSLHFSGTGYDCYRYNEIPSVGSIMVSPKYPWYVRNDYENMKSCIIYDNAKDCQKKIDKVISSKDYLVEMQNNAVSRFRQYHTSEVRYAEFKEFIHGAI